MKVFIAICLVALVYAEDSDKENIDLNVLDDLAAPYRSDIVDGSPAGECEFPSIVSLEINKNGRGFLCGGTLIDATHVLTAAHCVASGVSAIGVKMGSVNSQYPKLVREVSYISPHEGFSATNRALHNDVAMLTLDKPVPVTDCMKPIPLAKSSDSFERQNCVTAGWGKIGWKQSISATLRKVPISIMPYRECHKRWPNIGRENICAGDWINGGPSPCQGDSGGPLYCRSNDGRMVLAGIVSFGIKCEFGPALYTNVAYFRSWIDKHLK